MPISMNSPSASIVATPAGADCSSSASCSTRSLPHPLDIPLHALALKAQTTTYSGHCTQAATPLSFNSEFRGFVLPEQVEGHAIEQRKILSRVVLAFTVEVFAEADIEGPVQLVFNPPVLPDRLVQPPHVELEACDVVADFSLGLVRDFVVAFALDAQHCRKHHQQDLFK